MRKKDLRDNDRGDVLKVCTHQTIKDDTFISKSLKEIWELAQLVKQGSESNAPGCTETLVILALGRWRQEAPSLAELIRVPVLNIMGGRAAGERFHS